MVWDEEDLNRQRVEKMVTETGEGDGVLIFDDTGFAKQGMHSVGVARQYSGTLGKVSNCQVAVNCHYAERTLRLAGDHPVVPAEAVSRGPRSAGSGRSTGGSALPDEA